MQLAGAQLHIVEVGDGLAQSVGDVGEHRLKIAERLAGEVGIFGVHRLEGVGILYENGDAPVFLAVGPVALAGLSAGEKGEHLAVDVRIARYLAADVGGGAVDVVLQQIHVLEDGIVDALQYIVVAAVGLHQKGVVYESVAQRLYFQNVAVYGKTACYLSFFHMSDQFISLSALNTSRIEG